MAVPPGLCDVGVAMWMVALAQTPQDGWAVVRSSWTLVDVATCLLWLEELHG